MTGMPPKVDVEDERDSWTPSVAEGNRRLLELADIVERSTAYDQRVYMHPGCGTPACALGHWAMAHPERWAVSSCLIPIRRDSEDGYWGTIPEFALNGLEDDMALFGTAGCGNARNNNHAAAAFIRAFVARRCG